MTSYKYSKLNEPRPWKQPISWTAGSFCWSWPRKRPYFWPMSWFLTPRPRKGSFFRPPGSQSKLCLSRESSELSQGCQINWKTALTINSAESCDIFWVISDTAVGKILSNELKSTELCQKIKKYCHSARNMNSQINWNLYNNYNPQHPCRGYFVLSSHVFEKS